MHRQSARYEVVSLIEAGGGRAEAATHLTKDQVEEALRLFPTRHGVGAAGVLARSAETRDSVRGRVITLFRESLREHLAFPGDDTRLQCTRDSCLTFFRNSGAHATEALPDVLTLLDRMLTANEFVSLWKPSILLDEVIVAIAEPRLDLLVEATKHADARVRSTACRLLGRFKAHGSIVGPALSERLEDQDEWVAKVALASLIEVGWRDALTLRRAASRYPKLRDPMVRRAWEVGLRALAEVPPHGD